MARFMVGVADRPDTVEVVEVNGRTGVVSYVGGRLHSVLSLTVDGELITRIDIVLAPDKLSGVRSGRP